MGHNVSEARGPSSVAQPVPRRVRCARCVLPECTMVLRAAVPLTQSRATTFVGHVPLAPLRVRRAEIESLLFVNWS